MSAAFPSDDARSEVHHAGDVGSMANMSRGVLYIATGAKYVTAAIRSAQSVRRHTPDLPVHFFVDAHCAQACSFIATEPCTLGIIERPHPRSKVDYLAQTPFDQTLYLDSDTEVLCNVDELFQVLERFDLGMTHAHARNRRLTLETWRVPLPYAFPQYNTGVMIFRKTPAVEDLLSAWSEAYKSANFKKDQTTLRELLWLSDLRIATLPPEYNIRSMRVVRMWPKREAEPKILHLEKYHLAPLWSVQGIKERSLNYARRTVRRARAVWRGSSE